ncbi:acyl-CoA dehydrogenase family protein [uncultured Microbacterium sp.]|uniref:acyl-CoA dehydrogenase family protein n=2 Tax=Microbacterium TaxID=33882 RepID=UPI002598FF27|nr:acyl-CoA dehydrogenase family protein [uncultured Microbacterium sp.]
MSTTVGMVTTAAAGAYGRAADLDAYLGAPADPAGRMPLVLTLERDHDRVFPAEAVAALDAWGLPRHYVPEAFGGGLRDVFELLLLMRTVAARDLTVAVGHGKTVLGAISAWAAADDSAAHMARIVGAGEAVSWGLTEKDRGSDLAASQTGAVATGGGIRLDGHKWPIGNATRGRAITVLARTEDKPGPRALSLVLVDKTEVDPATLAYRARRPLHGIRGADISGIDFAGTIVSADRRVGAPGQGIEIVLKSLQVTRTLCAALSLGAGDQALAYLAAAGVDAAVIARGAADLLLAEAVAFAGARLFHVAPGEMALTSAFVKVLVPDLVDGVIRDGSPALGVSALLEDGPSAAWEKVARDAKVVSIFDGNSVVNLNVVINELPNIARGVDEEAGDVDAFAFDRDAGAFDMSGLRLVTRRGSRLLRSLPDLVERLDDGRAHPEAVQIARALVGVWRELAVRVHETERAARPPVAQFALAEQVTSVFAGAAAIAVFVANRDHASGDAWNGDLWLRAALARVTGRLAIDIGTLPAAELQQLAVGGSISLLPEWRAQGRGGA